MPEDCQAKPSFSLFYDSLISDLQDELTHLEVSSLLAFTLGQVSLMHRKPPEVGAVSSEHVFFQQEGLGHSACL
jgi:hypothetical protein